MIHRRYVKGYLSLLFMALSPIYGCGPADPILLEIPVIFEGDAPPIVYVDEDIEIHLSGATITIANLRMEKPIETTQAAKPLHPGHEGSGMVGGELLGTHTLLPLDGPALLGQAAIYDGPYATASLELPSGHQAQIWGEVWGGEDHQTFDFTIDLDSTVEGIDFEVDLVVEESPEALHLALDLEHALSYATWDSAQWPDSGPLTLDDSDFDTTLAFGLMSTATWQLKTP